MAVYVDHVQIPFKGMLMSHMTADNLDEIHEMATRIGMQHKWFQCPPKTRFPHYDIPEVRRNMALAHGARPVCSRTLLHYGAKLGIQWVQWNPEIIDELPLIAGYERTILRTQRYSLQPI